MDVSYQVAQYLATAGFGTLGTDIFASQIPAEQNGVYVTRLGGMPNKYVPIEETVLDIYVKDTSASDAITKLENIKRYIHRMHSTETSSAYFYTFLVIGDVEDVQRDMEYAKVFKITVQVMHRAKNLIS